MLLAFTLLAVAGSPEPRPQWRPPVPVPVIPVGEDAYNVEAWPLLRIGQRAYLRSTYDRTGGNEAADASHFLYQEREDFNCALDVAGAGVLYFERYNHWHGSPWHYEVDGADHVVTETSTADPDHPVANSVFEPTSAFPAPLALTWSETRGADLSWVPMSFTQSLRIGFGRTHYGTGYFIYDQFVPGLPLSRPLTGWTPAIAPSARLIRLFHSAGSDLAPAVGEGGLRLLEGTLDVPSGKTVPLWTDTVGRPFQVRAIELSVPLAEARALSDVRLQAFWDHREAASIDAPLGLFFGAGVFYNRDHREYLVQSLPMVVRYGADRVTLSCYFPMPYAASADFRLVGAETASLTGVRWRIRTQPLTPAPNRVGYFHATYRDHPHPVLGHDLVLLDTAAEENSPVWSGHLVGTSFIFSHRAVLSTLEGDPRFFFDDSQTPQVQGTGTEEWGGGGDYWGGLNMTLPFVGHPVGARNAQVAQNADDQIEAAYRFLLADLMPFGRNARIQLEHGGVDQSTEHYETVAYWYGLPAPSLVPTDTFSVGDSDDEAAHGYHSPDASRPYEVTSRYEWGPDSGGGQVFYPATTDHGRTTTSTSDFTLKIDPRNAGVMLRRKLDYRYPNQCAAVSIETAEGWKPAGLWLTAGSNTVVYSHPGRGKELGVAEHIVETSNRRFHDDEFLLPLDLTRGRSSIHIRVEFRPRKIPLFPGRPLPPLAWSELRYTAYSFVIPQFPLGR